MEEDSFTITLQLFAQAKDAVGTSEMELDVQSETAKAIVDSVPALKELDVPCAYAVNGKLVKPETVITERCTIAVLPPVSGG